MWTAKNGVAGLCVLVNFVASLAPNLGAFCTPDLEPRVKSSRCILEAAIDRGVSAAETGIERERTNKRWGDY